MGLIYKVVNDINDKVYIGKTSRSLEERWNQHINCHLNDNSYFHNSIKKYGVEHFYPIVIEDNIEDSLLNDREQYWIKYYNSYKNGYNSTLGGDGGTRFFPLEVIEIYYKNNENKEKTIEEIQCCPQVLNQILIKNGVDTKRQRLAYSHREIANKYLELLNINSVAEYFQIDRCTVIQALKDCNINTGHKKAIAQLDKETDQIINTFESQCQAAKILFNDVNKAKNISLACRGKIKSAYGFKWKFIEM